MDSVTQAVLGGAVGQAVAGGRVGRRAALWGAVAGTLPDLDILAYPFLDLAGQLYVHRGLTHGLAFGLVAGPALGAVVWHVERWRGRRDPARDVGTRRLWAWVITLALVTHPLLDVFTVYGTQLLAPFSDWPFAIGSVFILDPVVTVPLGVALGVALAVRPARRRAWAMGGLGVACAYLAFGVGAQAAARSTVEAAYASRGLRPDRLLVVAGPLSSLHWRGAADLGGRVEPFYLHVTSAPADVTVEPPLRPARLPGAVRGGRDGRALEWFSRGWLVQSGGSPLDVADLRFGRAGLDASDPFVFAWTLSAEPPYAARQRARNIKLEPGEGRRLWGSVLGRSGDAP